MIQINEQLKNFKRPSPHAKFGPSSADRWINCPYSVEASKNIVQESSVYADQGTVAHELCEHVFRRDFFGTPIPQTALLKIALEDDQGEEMMNCAESYVELISEWLKMESLGNIIWYGLERGIPVFPEEECFGTGDFTIIGTKGCAIIDFKYGAGREVGVDSTQLKMYGLGVWRYLSNLPDDYEVNTVVYQPRISAIPKWSVYYNDDMKEFAQETWAAIHKSKEKDLEPCEGSHCFWCPLKRTKNPAEKCPLIKNKALEVANKNFDSFFKDMNTPVVINDTGVPDTKRDAALLKIISLAPLIKKMAEDADDEIQFRLAQGEAIPGCSIRNVSGRRAWRSKKLDEMASMITSKFPGKILDAVKVTKKVMSITDVEKIVGKNNVDDLVTIPIKKVLFIEDDKTKEVLGKLSDYSKMMST